MTFGPVVMAAGTIWLMVVDADVTYWRDVLPGLTVFSLGLALMVAPLTATVHGRRTRRQCRHSERHQQRRRPGRVAPRGRRAPGRGRARRRRLRRPGRLRLGVRRRDAGCARACSCWAARSRGSPIPPRVPHTRCLSAARACAHAGGRGRGGAAAIAALAPAARCVQRRRRRARARPRPPAGTTPKAGSRSRPRRPQAARPGRRPRARRRPARARTAGCGAPTSSCSGTRPSTTRW